MVDLFQLPLRVWRDILRADRVRAGDIRQRNGLDDHGLHRGAIPRHLPPLPLSYRQQAQSCRQAHHSYLDTLLVSRCPSGTFYSSCQPVPVKDFFLNHLFYKGLQLES